MAVLLGLFVGTLLDPVRWIGEALAGAFVRPLWLSLLLGAGWSVVVSLVMASMRTVGGIIPEALIASALSGLVVTGLVFWLSDLLRRRRAKSK